MTTEAQEAIRRYISNSLGYLENALVFLQRREAGKASELLWGSMAEALQAVAASRGMHLVNHRSLRHFASTIAKELGDASLFEGFRHADALHSNFYEVELEPEDIGAVVEPIRKTVAKLLALIPGELFQESAMSDSQL